MKRLLLPILLLAALPAAAQDRPAASAPSSGGSGAGANAGTSGPSNGGGGSSGGGGGAVSNGGGGSSGSGGVSSGGGGGSVGSTGGRVDVGGRHVATGGSGVAVTRGDRGGDRGGYSGNGGANGSGRRDRGDSGGGTAVATPRGGTGTDGRATGRREAGPITRTPDGDAVPPHARPRDNQPVTGKAVPRGTVPTVPVTGGGGVGIAGFYPWWFGGAYGGYYGGYYDPWFGGYPGGGGYYDPAPVYQGYRDEGSLRLKIKPKDAEVYVDGYFVGVVDDFDGIFQRLHVETGPHRVEVRAAGYEPLMIDVRVTPDHSTTYQGELKRIQ